MAKVVTTELEHSGASAANITLDSSKNVTIGNNLTVTGTVSGSNYSARNLIINGAMNVSQRGTTTTTSGQFVLDRFKAGWAGADENITHAKRALTSSDTGPWAEGFRNCLSLTNGNQTSGAGAGDDVWIEYPAEDQDIACSGWQAESATSKLTISFWLKASVAQTYYVLLETKHGTSKNYAFATTISSANVWQKFTKTIPGHADISFGNDNGEGIDIYFIPFYGTNKTTSGHTVDSWSNTSGSDQAPDMTSTWWTTNDATYELTGVQLEVGETATEFEHRSYGDELARCQRYYCNIIGYDEATGSGNISLGGTAAFFSTSQPWIDISFPVTMRAAPSIDCTNRTNLFMVASAGSTYQAPVCTLAHATKNTASLYMATTTTASAGAAGNSAWQKGNASAGDHIALNAEL